MRGSLTVPISNAKIQVKIPVEVKGLEPSASTLRIQTGQSSDLRELA